MVINLHCELNGLWNLGDNTRVSVSMRTVTGQGRSASYVDGIILWAKMSRGMKWRKWPEHQHSPFLLPD